MKQQLKVYLGRTLAVLFVLFIFGCIGAMVYQDAHIEYDMVCTDASGVTYESGWSNSDWFKNTTGATVSNRDSIHSMEPTETCTQLERHL